MIIDTTAFCRDLDKLCIECGMPNWDGYNALPIKDETKLNAAILVQNLPFSVMPEACGEPDGCICLDYGSRDNIMSVSVSPAMKIVWAATVKGMRACGNFQWIITEPLPPVFLMQIAEVIGPVGMA